jgi:hypothetical protein
VSVSALLVAARFCRERRALLIIDPPCAWDSPAAAVRALERLDFHSENAVMFYPRIVATDRLRGRLETFGNGGAAAGLLSRSGEAAAAAREPEPLLRANAKAAEVHPNDRWLLGAHGINVLQTVRSATRERPAMRTLACGASASSDGSYLTQRRFTLFVINAIERGTRWCALAAGDPTAWPRVTRQIRAFLEELRAAGAFASVPPERAFLVICDERINELNATSPCMNVLVQFAIAHASGYHSFLLTHSTLGAVVRPVAVNRLEASLIVSHELEQEITIPLKPHERQAVIPSMTGG